MMAPSATRITAIVIFVTLGIAANVLAAGPVFDPPLDGAKVSGEVFIRAQKSHLDGNENGYVSL